MLKEFVCWTLTVLMNAVHLQLHVESSCKLPIYFPQLEGTAEAQWSSNGYRDMCLKSISSKLDPLHQSHNFPLCYSKLRYILLSNITAICQCTILHTEMPSLGWIEQYNYCLVYWHFCFIYDSETQSPQSR